MKQGDCGKTVRLYCGMDWRRMEKPPKDFRRIFSWAGWKLLHEKILFSYLLMFNEVVHDPAHVAERCAGLLFNALALARCNRVKHQHCRRADRRAVISPFTNPM